MNATKLLELGYHQDISNTFSKSVSGVAISVVQSFEGFQLSFVVFDPFCRGTFGEVLRSKLNIKQYYKMIGELQTRYGQKITSKCREIIIEEIAKLFRANGVVVK